MTPATRRERLREATLQEIADAARDQLRTVGARGLTLSAVAREVGMSAPALYRYVDGVDGLLTLLIAQGYESLAREVQAAHRRGPRRRPGGRFVAMALGAADWAVRDVAQYGLIFGTPLPGYAAPRGARRPRARAPRRRAVAGAGRRAGGRTARRAGHRRGRPRGRPVLQAKTGGLAGQLPERVQAAGWAALALLLGAVAIDVFGHMPPCDEPVRRALFRGQVQAARCLVGLPAPKA